MADITEAEITPMYQVLFEELLGIIPIFVGIFLILLALFIFSKALDLLNFVFNPYIVRTEEDQVLTEWNDGSTIEKIKGKSEEENLDFYWKETGE